MKMSSSTRVMPVDLADDIHDIAFEAGRLMGRMEEASKRERRPDDGGSSST